MRLQPEQLILFARLTDEWLDVPPSQQQQWLMQKRCAHPDLAQALLTLQSDAGNDASTIDPLSFAGLASTSVESNSHHTGDLFGPYRLRSLLGRGGMAEVWLAEQVDGRLQRQLAIKIPLQGVANNDWLARFERERDIQAGLNHPGIAKLFDAGLTTSGQPYLAMQYVAGESLLDYAATRQLPLPDRLQLFIQLLDVVQHAHAALVVHRDLKPSNILVDHQGRVMLLDFGIAKLLGNHAAPFSDEATVFTSPALTLDYASPEQVMGRTIGTGTDIYSLGVVLCELLTGRRPYRLRRTTRAAVEEAILEQELTAPSTRATATHANSMGLSARALSRQLRGDLDAIILKALRKPVEQRYSSAYAFAQDLLRWQAKQPVSAQPDALSYRFRRFMTRNWRYILAATTVSIALITTTIIALSQAREARLASALAQREAHQAEVVTGFLQDLFLRNSVGQADPEAGRKRTAEQLMADAAARISVALADAPEQQIALLHKMATTYFEMRLPERAIALSRQAADLAERVYGPDHVRTKFLQTRWMLWSVTGGDAEQFDAQRQPLLRSLPILATSSRPDERQLAMELGDVLMNREFEMRAQLALQYARWREPIFAQAEPITDAVVHHHMQAVVYLQNLLFDEATRHFAASQSWLNKLGSAGGAYDSYPIWHGRLQELKGNYTEAERLMKQGYAMERHNDAGSNRLNDWCLANYSRFLVDTGRAAEGLALATHGGPLASASIKAKLATSLRALLAQAHALARLGRAEQALTKAERAQRMLMELAPEALRPPLPVLVESLLTLGRAAQAEQILDREEPRMAQGQASIIARLLAEYRIRTYLALDQAQQARTYLESRRAILAPPQSGPLEHARLAWLEAAIALKQHRAADARQITQNGLQRLADSDSTTQIYLQEWQARLQDRLGDAALALGDDGAARHAYEAALAAYQQTVDPHYSLSLGRILHQLAILALRRGDSSAAVQFQAQANAILAHHPDHDGWGA